MDVAPTCERRATASAASRCALVMDFELMGTRTKDVLHQRSLVRSKQDKTTCVLVLNHASLTGNIPYICLRSNLAHTIRTFM